MSFEESNFSNESFTFHKKTINIKNAKEFLKQPANSNHKNLKNIENLYYIKPSLNDNSRTHTVTKSQRLNLYSNLDENSTLLKPSESSFNKCCKISFCTSKEFKTKNNSHLQNLQNLDESLIFDPNDSAIKNKFVLQKNQSISKIGKENQVFMGEKEIDLLEKEKKIKEQTEMIYQLNEQIINLKEENNVLKLESEQLKKNLSEQNSERDESEKLKFKNLNIKNFKLQSENKSLYEFLSKTQFQCNESSVLQKFKDLENYFQNSEQKLNNTNENLKSNTLEIINFREYLKKILNSQEKTIQEENKKDQIISDQLRITQKQVFCLLELMKGILEIFEGIKRNQDIDIEDIFLKKPKFHVIKPEDFQSENILKLDEYPIFLHEIEHNYKEILEVLENLSILASEFYNQKYFNKFLLG